MTTDQTNPRPEGHAAEPLALRLSDQLGPEERAQLDALLDHIHEYGTTAEGVLLRAARLCQAARAAEREQCAKECDDYAETYPLTERNARANRRAARVLAEKLRGA